ncbi:TetR/AcrR family transcriptional regulator [Lujinxingia vulgaris]|uniref:TetR/AcrR family transcriptional regulator n=1 Tax=Lujinxingia vulgaris TaxID=2600176 RepID=A0A5C6XA14_9DELT|nr:TetR family transcriptional regulator [Lujinxingia vulgaris]TXD36034.1 TetR/AcrR family transcriptional regulator [Lujinxingia vulgaris]
MSEGRDRILKAAEDLFGTYGFDRISVRDIAERAEVNKALIFYHFNSKDELFETVLLHYFESHTEALRDAWEATGTLRDRVHNMIDGYVDFIVEHRNWPKLVQHVAATEHSEHIPTVRRGLTPMIAWANETFGEIAPDEGPLSVRNLFETVAGSVLHHFTYASVLAPMWQDKPLAEEHIAERRAHLHWLVDVLLDAVESRAHL